jgi:hypothetical protein
MGGKKEKLDFAALVAAIRYVHEHLAAQVDKGGKP